MKKFSLLVFCLIYSLSFSACGGSAKDDSTAGSGSVEQTAASSAAGTLNGTDPGKAAESQDSKDIALVMKTLTNPFFIEMEKGARKAESEFGINLIVKTGAKETSIEQQISIVEELILDKVDAIVIAPGSSTELVPVLKKAQDANIRIVNIDNRLDPAYMEKVGLVDVPFISVDNEEGAYLSAKYVSDMITVPTKAAILEGIRGADNAEQRKNGALRAFAGNKNIQVVASETANWKIDEAHDIVMKMYTDNSDIGVIFCANDMMALGVVQYLQESKREGVLIAGFDALEEAKKAIANGDMTVTINQQADVQGYLGVKYAYEMLQGKTQPAETFVDVKLVTADTK
ncbi:MAG: sugar ABC transporter substrate-binding protein [Clostridiales bacterium]|nr:sugar ABC transporter substrate-binding protein [Clostridiales bacterium]